MKDRIKKFIDTKGITAGELAVALDVQRSNISHILNGRNKPGAAFIEKLLITFPDLNARWLLTGEGEMIANDENNRRKVPEQLILNEPVSNDTKIETKEIDTEEVSVKEIDSNNIPDNNTEIDRMIILFNDGTFTTYKHR